MGGVPWGGKRGLASFHPFHLPWLSGGGGQPLSAGADTEQGACVQAPNRIHCDYHYHRLKSCSSSSSSSTLTCWCWRWMLANRLPVRPCLIPWKADWSTWGGLDEKRGKSVRWQQFDRFSGVREIEKSAFFSTCLCWVCAKGRHANCLLL